MFRYYVMRFGKCFFFMLDYMNFVYVNVGLVMEGIYYRIIDLCNFLYDFKKKFYCCLIYDLKIIEWFIFFLEKKIYWINNDDLIILKRIYNIIIGNNFV